MGLNIRSTASFAEETTSLVLVREEMRKGCGDTGGSGTTEVQSLHPTDRHIHEPDTTFE